MNKEKKVSLPLKIGLGLENIAVGVRLLAVFGLEGDSLVIGGDEGALEAILAGDFELELFADGLFEMAGVGELALDARRGDLEEVFAAHGRVDVEKRRELTGDLGT